MKKILLDTDIGSDIDDALCLAYLLSHPDCDLLGITTVSGEAHKRAELASALCRKVGRDLPIYPGVELPLMGHQLQPDARQHMKLSDWAHDTDFPRNRAVSFLRQTIRDNPGEITLLAIGPLTNIALLFALDREIPSLFGELVLMCGRFENKIPGAPLVEWNAGCDPYAAAIVFQSSVSRFRSVGLDVTMQLQMSKQETEQYFKAEILTPVKDFAGVWFERAKTITFHDPLAAAILFDETLCSYRKGRVEVELTSEKLKGLTHFIPGEEGNSVEIAQTVTPSRFFDHFFDVINQ